MKTFISHHVRSLASAGIIAASLSLASTTAHAAPPTATHESTRYVASDRTLVIMEGEEVRGTLTLPCAASAALVHAEHLYVGCADGQMRVYGIDGADRYAPVQQLEHRYDRPVIGFVIRDGKVFAKAPPAPKPAPAAPPVAAPPPPAAAPTTPPTKPAAGPSDGVAPLDVANRPPARPSPETMRAEIEAAKQSRRRAIGKDLTLQPSHVIIGLGTGEGIQLGDRVELFRDEEVDMGLDESTTRHVTEAVGRVVDVSEHRARIDLGLREVVSPDAKAVETNAPATRSPLAPPRVGGITEFSATARPFLAWKARGGGAILDTSLIRRFKRPVALHLLTEPVGVGIAQEGTQVLAAATAHGLVSWDIRYFEFGAGLGWSVVAGNFDNNAFAIPQVMRLGAIDGLNVRLFNQFVLLQDRWAWGGTNVRAQIPVTRTAERWWIETAGGAGIAGYGFFEGGVRFLLWGNGAHNSFFLRGAVGWAQLRGHDGQNSVTLNSQEQFSHQGPMGSFGFEWRPGKRPKIGRNGAPGYGKSHKY